MLQASRLHTGGAALAAASQGGLETFVAGALLARITSRSFQQAGTPNIDPKVVGLFF